ncbi:hypothetical protein PUN28_012536 [Cardiocondyla obscurior]|uniref:Uncharacterized protein n=1 Tax=Cardiocondyla obscurior TaxID=286306 RepID=A0AAW2FD74_9HYME
MYFAGQVHRDVARCVQPQNAGYYACISPSLSLFLSSFICLPISARLSLSPSVCPSTSISLDAAITRAEKFEILASRDCQLHQFRGRPRITVSSWYLPEKLPRNYTRVKYATGSTTPLSPSLVFQNKLVFVV